MYSKQESRAIAKATARRVMSALKNIESPH